MSLSSDDRRLLLLLARLVAGESSGRANFVPGREVVLSDAEAHELVRLLEEFSASRRFRDGSYFVEQLFSGEEPSAAAREIYLQWRKRNGRSRSLASTHWQEFLVRLGLSREYGGYLRGTYGIQARRMDVYKFLDLERRLLEHSDVSPRVRALLLRFISAHAKAIEAVRDREQYLPSGSLANLPHEVSIEVEASRRLPTGVKPMSTQKLAGIMTVVIDMSALFTTRDWNVVGTLSSLAGALVAASAE